MPLAHLNFCYGTPSYVAAGELEFCGQSVLSHPSGFPDFPDILADFVFDFLIHNITVCTSIGTIILDIIVRECYDWEAPI